MKFKWELINTIGENERTLRAKVPGGWLIEKSDFQEVGESCALSSSMVFISDPNYGWVIEKE